MKQTTTNPIAVLGYSTENKEMIKKTCGERKKIGFETLKAWDENTKHNLQVSKEFIEELLSRIEILLTESAQRFDMLSLFLEKLVVQIGSDIQLSSKMQLFSLDDDTPVSSLESMPRTQLKEKEPMLYTMLAFNREYEVFSKKLRDTTQRVKSEIIEKVLGKTIRPYEKTVKQLQAQIQDIKKLMLKRSGRTEDKLKKLGKVFQEGMVDQTKARRVRKNIFDSALDFTKSVRSLDITITDFGLLLIALWEQCNILEEKRLSAIRQALMKFFDIMVEVFGSDAQKSFENR